MRFYEFVQFFVGDFAFGNAVNKDKLVIGEVVGDVTADIEVVVDGIEAFQFFFKGVAVALFYGAKQHFAVVFGQVFGKVNAEGGFAGFGFAVNHAGKAHGGITDQVTVLPMQTDGLEVHV